MKHTQCPQCKIKYRVADDAVLIKCGNCHKEFMPQAIPKADSLKLKAESEFSLATVAAIAFILAGPVLLALYALSTPVFAMVCGKDGVSHRPPMRSDYLCLPAANLKADTQREPRSESSKLKAKTASSVTSAADPCGRNSQPAAGLTRNRRSACRSRLTDQLSACWLRRTVHAKSAAASSQEKKVMALLHRARRLRRMAGVLLLRIGLCLIAERRSAYPAITPAEPPEF